MEHLSTSDDYEDVATLTRRAETGDSSAQYVLATRYLHGKDVPEDPTRAFELALQAAQQGHVEASLMVGDCYHGGHGVDQDYKQAFDWYRKSAEAAEAMVLPQTFIAFCKMARMYEVGQGVERDEKKAAEFIKTALVQEHPEAQYIKAMMELENSSRETVKTKRESARRYLGLAIDSGHSLPCMVQCIFHRPAGHGLRGSIAIAGEGIFG